VHICFHVCVCACVCMCVCLFWVYVSACAWESWHVINNSQTRSTHELDKQALPAALQEKLKARIRALSIGGDGGEGARWGGEERELKASENLLHELESFALRALPTNTSKRGP